MAAQEREEAMFGALAEVPVFGPLTLRVMARYVRKGFDPMTTPTVQADYVEVPVLASVDLTRLLEPLPAPYVFAGFSPGVAVRCHEFGPTASGYKDVPCGESRGTPWYDVGFTRGVGVRLRVGPVYIFAEQAQTEGRVDLRIRGDPSVNVTSYMAGGVSVAIGHERGEPQ